jgi:succinate dehydrogenase / fumarate reductase membrane anchor subunit
MDTNMKKDATSFRSLLGRARGLGSAKEGVEHWWLQRLTAIALVPLSLYIMGSFFNAVVFGSGYQSALGWLHSPLAATAMILILIAGFWHAILGVQVVIEDYVHCEVMKLTSIILVKLAGFALAALGILAVARIYFMGLPHA